jgi:hypothetical protein
MRGALRAVFTGLPTEEMAQQLERGRLILAVPALRMRMLDQLADVTQLTAQLVAKRVGRGADEFAVRTFAGAMVGGLMSGLLIGIEVPTADFLALMDASLAYLEAGMPL